MMARQSAPALVLVAHGTRSGKGVEMIAALAEAVGQELARRHGPGPAGSCRDPSGPGRDRRPVRQRGPEAAAGCGGMPSERTAAPAVRTAFVDVLGPSPAEVLCDLTADPAVAVVVPAFLASGYHVYRDVPREVADSGRASVTVTAAIGPDPALARVMALRLRAAGWCPGDAVVFAAAGSTDRRARADVGRAAALLTGCLSAPVRIAYIATGAPRVPDVVTRLRESGHQRVFIASYLLAHGLFQQRLHDAGATGVAEPLGVHPAAVGLIADRYHAAVAAAREQVR